jgi:hypothetical protein
MFISPQFHNVEENVAQGRLRHARSRPWQCRRPRLVGGEFGTSPFRGHVIQPALYSGDESVPKCVPHKFILPLARRLEGADDDQHIKIASTAALHARRPGWVISGQTIAGQNLGLSAVVQERTNAGVWDLRLVWCG